MENQPQSFNTSNTLWTDNLLAPAQTEVVPQAGSESFVPLDEPITLTWLEAGGDTIISAAPDFSILADDEPYGDTFETATEPQATATPDITPAQTTPLAAAMEPTGEVPRVPYVAGHRYRAAAAPDKKSILPAPVIAPKPENKDAQATTGQIELGEIPAADTLHMSVIRSQSGRSEQYKGRHWRESNDTTQRPETGGASVGRRRIVTLAAAAIMLAAMGGSQIKDGLTGQGKVSAQSEVAGSAIDRDALPIRPALKPGETPAAAPAEKPAPPKTSKLTRMKQKIAEYAWPNYRRGGTRAALDTKTAYQKAVDAAEKRGEYSSADGIDCGVFVTRVMRDSGADPNYNDQEGNTLAQKKYLAEHSDVGHKKGDPILYHRVGSDEKLQPGDIAVQNGYVNGRHVHHTFFYVGNAIDGLMKKKGKPVDFQGNVASASLDVRAPMASSMMPRYEFQWYRLIAKNKP